MGDVDGHREGLGPESRARFMVRFSIECIGRIGLLRKLGSGFNVRVGSRYRFSVTGWCG